MRVVAILVTGLLMLTGCSFGPPAGADELAERLALALASGDFSQVAIDEDASDDYEALTDAMPTTPDVTVGDITYADDDTQAEVTLDYSWTLGSQSWSYTTVAHLSYDEQWSVTWSPEIVHPSLSDDTRLGYSRTLAKRADIIDTAGRAIVETRQVYRIGIDKTAIAEADLDSSARKLAELVNVDTDAYVAQVRTSGPEAFVVAITLRQGHVPSEIGEIPGAIAVGDELPLAPSSTFARGLLGTVSEATAEDIENSQGNITAGELVGQSGLQLEHDKTLRGENGHLIQAVPRDGTGDTLDLFSTAANPGQSLRISLDVAMQTKAEEILADFGDALVMVAVVDVTDGSVAVLANSPAAGAQNFAAEGLYPPGSTMKVVSSLVFLRDGHTPGDHVECSATYTVNGREFHNYPGYPAAHTGSIPVTRALEQSCNTAFMRVGVANPPDALAKAGADLGLGVDTDTGFNATYGRIPASDDDVVRAANSIGQGDVQLSVLSLAGMSASVKAERTIVPWLIDGTPPHDGDLTPDEARMLQEMMSSVVSPAGTASQLGGVLQGAKTGTAEYGSDSPPKTHTWITGYNDRYAIAVMDFDSTNTQRVDAVVRGLLG